MAKEGRIRKVNPRDWPGFLRRVIPAAVWQAFLGQVVASGDPRVRWTPKYVLLSEASWSRIERQGQHQMVYLWPQNRRSQLPLRLRLIVLKRSGKRVYLLTNVLESQRLSRALAGELYAARWGVETDYRALKQTLERRRVLAETPAVGALELAGNILALALLLLQAAVAQGARLGRVSVAGALRAVRQALECTRWRQSSGWFVAALHAARRDDYHRRRSKRARDWPRKKKDPPPRPPNLRSPTPREKAYIQAVELYYALKLG